MNSKPAGKLDPRTFDLDGWITGIQSVTKTVPLYQRADLLDDIQQARRKIDAAEINEQNEDVGVADRDPRHALIEQHNALVAEFEASRVDFKFRPFRAGDRNACLEAMAEAGFHAPVKPDVPDSALGAAVEQAFADEQEKFNEEATLHMTARCAISPKMTVEQVRAIREAFGEMQYQFLVAAWGEASVNLPGDMTPLSLPLSPTPTDDER